MGLLGECRVHLVMDPLSVVWMEPLHPQIVLDDVGAAFVAEDGIALLRPSGTKGPCVEAEVPHLPDALMFQHGVVDLFTALLGASPKVGLALEILRHAQARYRVRRLPGEHRERADGLRIEAGTAAVKFDVERADRL